jgi:4-amino-4-deoxy-L-arabinose transferase-like glycosyltransferase
MHGIEQMMQRTENGLPCIPLWLVWVCALGFVLTGLGSFGILDNNEGLYAEIPREMLASHDWRQWIIPHLNGLPYMEKPPLLYWLTAMSFSLFGASEWSARLAPALSSLACVALLLRFGSTVGRQQAGRLAALMFVTGIGVTAMSRVLMFDMLLTALLTAALMFAFRFLAEAKPRCLRLSYGFLALALMAKGFVALVLFGLVIVAFVLVTQRSLDELRGTFGKLIDPWAILVFFAIAAPWHLAASQVEPIFPWFYFINEHVLRFLGTREPHDYYSGSWWYYLPRMAIYLFPWSFYLPSLFPAIMARSRGGEIARQGGGALQRFLWLAWLAPLVFFSISSAKANYYLVAVMPFAAFHLATAIESRRISSGIASAAPGLLIGVLALVFCAMLMLREEQPQQALIISGLAERDFLIAASAGLALLAFGAALLAWRKLGPLPYFLVAAWTMAALGQVLAARDAEVSTRELAKFLQTEFPGRSVYLYRNFEEQSSLPFYLKRTIPVIDPRSNDLFWGDKLRVNDIMLSADRFAPRLKDQSIAVLVMDRQIMDFRATGFFPRFKAEKRIGKTTVFFN